MGKPRLVFGGLRFFPNYPKMRMGGARRRGCKGGTRWGWGVARTQFAVIVGFVAHLDLLHMGLFDENLSWPEPVGGQTHTPEITESPSSGRSHDSDSSPDP